MKRLCVGFACALLLFACDDEDGGPSDVGADQAVDVAADVAADAVQGSVVIVSELPVTGPFNAVPLSVANAIEQALDDHGGTACGGAWEVTHQSSDHTGEDGVWDGDIVAANGADHIADPDVVAVIGTYNSGAAAVLIPILNEADLVMVSPANTYAGLTQSEGAAEGEPDSYYPTGRRNYARVVGGDHLQGRVGAQWAASLGATSLYMIDDSDLYGIGLAGSVTVGAEAEGLTVVGSSSIESGTDFSALATTIVAADPDLVYLAGATIDPLADLLVELDTAGYDGLLMGGDGLVAPELVEAAGEAAEGVYVTLPGVDPSQLTGAAAVWGDAYEARYGAPPESFAAEAYAVMQVILAAFDRACAAGDALTDRDAVRQSVLATRAVETLIGPVTFDDNGDITTPAYVGLRIVDGEFEFDTALELE